MEIFQQPFQTFIQQLLLFIPKLVAALITFGVTLYAAGWIAKVIRRICRERKLEASLTTLFERVGRWSLIVLGTIWALDQVDFNVTAFVAGLGIAGFTIGFALQDIAKNFVAGIMLLLQQPFTAGEAISVAGYSGTVEEISLRATELRTWDGLLVYIPNADVYTNPLTNFARVPRRRLELSAGVAYGTDLDYASEVALEAIKAVPGLILDDPAPSVVFNSFGESSIDFTLYYWFDSGQTGLLEATDGGLKAVKRAFEEAQIEIPFPIRTLYVQGAPAAG